MRACHRSVLVVLVALGASLVLPAAAQESAWRGGGPDGGWVIHLSRPFGVQGSIFAGTYGGGLYRSDDGGLHWVEASSNARDAVVGDVAVGEEGTLYAATEDRGVLRLDVSAGDVWIAANAGLNDPSLPFVFGVETHPGSPMRVSASTSAGTRTSRTRASLWPDSLIVVSSVMVRDLLVLEEMPNTIHSAAAEQLVISTGWAPTMTRAIDAPDLQREGQLLPNLLFDLARWPGSTDSLLVVDFEGGLLQLRDREELVSIGPDFGTGPYARFYEVSVDEGDTGPVIRLGSDRGLFVSDDVGEQWELLVGSLHEAKPEIWAVLADDAQAGDLLLGSFVHGVLRARRDEAWQRSNEGIAATWVRSVDAHAGQLLLGTAHGGLYHGTDGESWTAVGEALDDIQFAAVHFARNGSAWLAAGFTDAYRSTDHGATWSPLAVPASVIRIDRFVETSGSSPRIYAATNDGLLVSEDEGASWDWVTGAPRGRPSFALTTMQHAPDVALVAAGFDPAPATNDPPSLWWSDAAGEWHEIELPLGFRGRIRGLSFLANAAGCLAVAATPSGGPIVYEVRGLLDEGAPVFTSLAPGLGGRILFPVDLVGDAARDVLVLATDFDGIFVSEDAGHTWSEWNEGLLTSRIEQIALDRAPAPGTQRRLVAGTFARGAWVRESPGRVAVAVDGPWVERVADAVLVRARVDGTLPARLIRHTSSSRTVVAQSERGGELSVRETIEELRSLASNRIAWSVEVELEGEWREIASSSRELAELVATLRDGLLSAAPNPFNPRTSIRWEQERAGAVVLELVDLRGRIVRRLIDGTAGPGRHTFPWDGTDEQNRSVASGTYIVRLQLEGRSHHGRVTLIR